MAAPLGSDRAGMVDKRVLSGPARHLQVSPTVTALALTLTSLLFTGYGNDYGPSLDEMVSAHSTYEELQDIKGSMRSMSAAQLRELKFVGIKASARTSCTSY